MSTRGILRSFAALLLVALSLSVVACGGAGGGFGGTLELTNDYSFFMDRITIAQPGGPPEEIFVDLPPGGFTFIDLVPGPYDGTADWDDGSSLGFSFDIFDGLTTPVTLP